MVARNANLFLKKENFLDNCQRSVFQLLPFCYLLFVLGIDCYFFHLLFVLYCLSSSYLYTYSCTVFVYIVAFFKKFFLKMFAYTFQFVGMEIPLLFYD